MNRLLKAVVWTKLKKEKGRSYEHSLIENQSVENGKLIRLMLSRMTNDKCNLPLLNELVNL